LLSTTYHVHWPADVTQRCGNPERRRAHSKPAPSASSKVETIIDLLAKRGWVDFT
jgi:hypothetical protein